MSFYDMPTGPLAGLRYALPLSVAFWSIVAVIILNIA
jgi:hypothetical protein